MKFKTSCQNLNLCHVLFITHIDKYQTHISHLLHLSEASTNCKWNNMCIFVKLICTFFMWRSWHNGASKFIRSIEVASSYLCICKQCAICPTTQYFLTFLILNENLNLMNMDLLVHCDNKSSHSSILMNVFLT
jgi:hypothetical protein